MAKGRHKPWTSEEAQELGKKYGRDGGIKSGKRRRLKRTLKEWALMLRDAPAKADPKMNMGGAVILKMYDSAIAGDVKAARLLAELQGEMVEQIAMKELPKLIDDI